MISRSIVTFGDSNLDLLWAPLRGLMLNSGALDCCFFHLLSVNQIRTVLYLPASL